MISKAKFVLSKKDMLKQYEIMNDFADEVSYSIKTNPTVGMLLEKLTNCSFSVHSHKLLGEIKNKSRVWFFGQGWDKNEIKELLKLGVERFIVDNEEDFDVLLDSIDEKKIQLLLRMRLKEHTIHTGKHFVFGLTSDKVNALVKKVKDDERIEKIGVHFHRKTQNISEWGLVDELSQSLTEETLNAIDVLNMGGGMPIDYKNSRVGTSDKIFEEIGMLKKWLSDFKIKMIIEPGRFIAGPCVKLVSTIKRIYNNNIIVDCSVFNGAMDTFVANVRLKIQGEVSEGEGKAYTVKGCTPDSMDILRYRVYIKEPKQGDTIVFLNAGAYNFATSFCGLDKIPTEVINDE